MNSCNTNFFLIKGNLKKLWGNGRFQMKLVGERIAVTFLKGDSSVHTKCRQSAVASRFNDPSAVRHPTGVSLHGHRDPSTELFTGMLLVRANS